ncbi:MAG: NAD-dependent epimerase/dehydratase family protein [Myxococcales bacterium]|nr:NAD-dependent epimerase/dehydratase family protein [Myxococcales bacterium]
MRFAITGASGFLGGNLAITLLEAGHEVVATKRDSSYVEHLSAFPIEWKDASLGQKEALQEAFAGCDGVFHCAAAVSVQYKIEPWVEKTNIDGTRNVIDACLGAGVKRLVHCSTVSALGVSVDGEPSDETVPFNFPEHHLGDAYVMTKRRSQDIVLEAAKSEIDAVIVNPTFMIGPYDIKPSSGALVQSILLGKIPGYTLGTNNFVNVRDVTLGMLAAFEKGRRGEMYILGGENMTYKAFMDLVSEATGAPQIRFRVPNWAARVAGWWGDRWSSMRGKEVELNSATVEWSLNNRYLFRSDKAARELGYTNTSLRQAILDCTAWFRENGKI